MASVVDVRQVQNAKERFAFIKLPWRIYQDDPRWVAPVIADQERFLDPKHGPFFEHGQAELFLAYRDGQAVGRISAQVNRHHDGLFDDGKGFFGFFDCINDPEVARALFDRAQRSLEAHGRKTMEGPYSFTIYDEIGVLIDGFPYDPYFLTVYNKPYYANLFEHSGFEKTVDWYAFRGEYLGTGKSVTQKYGALSKRILSRASLNMRHMDTGKHFEREAAIIKELFRTAFDGNWGHVPMSEKEFDRIADFVKLIVCPELSLIAEVNGKPVGFSLVIYDANYAIKKLNGRLYPFGFIRLLANLKKAKRCRLILMGMLEEYRGKGYELPFYVHLAEHIKACGFDEAELSLVVETNAGLLRTLEKIPDLQRYKTYRIFHKTIGQ
jgi:GNAT superfamily N-acetyltransferase